MVVATHNPETCAYASEKYRLLAVEGASKVADVAIEHGCVLQGAWANRASHTLYALMEGPNAHAVEEVLFKIRFPEWQTVRIDPVVDMGETIEDLLGS